MKIGNRYTILLVLLTAIPFLGNAQSSLIQLGQHRIDTTTYKVENTGTDLLRVKRQSSPTERNRIVLMDDNSVFIVEKGSILNVFSKSLGAVRVDELRKQRRVGVTCYVNDRGRIDDVEMLIPSEGKLTLKEVDLISTNLIKNVTFKVSEKFKNSGKTVPIVQVINFSRL